MSFLLLISLTSYSQNNHIIDITNMSESEATHLYQTVSKDGWVLIKHQGDNYIRNFSNPDYIFSLSINCSEPSKKPGYLIEFSDHYGDGEMGGIDFISSASDTYAKTIFFLDGKKYENPFTSATYTDLSSFYDGLKKAKKLTIEVFDKAFNPETGKDELKKNRSIDFILANAELLEQTVKCR